METLQVWSGDIIRLSGHLDNTVPQWLLVKLMTRDCTKDCTKKLHPSLRPSLRLLNRLVCGVVHLAMIYGHLVIARSLVLVTLMVIGVDVVQIGDGRWHLAVT